MAPSLCGDEAQTLRSPVPTPAACSDCRVHELNHRNTTWGSSERRLLLRSDTKTNPPTLDDDRLSSFSCVKEKRQLLSGFGSSKAFHIVQCTIPIIPAEAPSVGKELGDYYQIRFDSSVLSNGSEATSIASTMAARLRRPSNL